MTAACISTSPTEEGDKEIDAMSMNFRVKRLNNYPIA